MDNRWHFGGPYGYEFDCQIIPPVGSGLASRLESQAGVFLGQLEEYRRANNLQSLTWYSQDSAGNFYEYGVIMGRPYAIIKVAGFRAETPAESAFQVIEFACIPISASYTTGYPAPIPGNPGYGSYSWLAYLAGAYGARSMRAPPTGLAAVLPTVRRDDFKTKFYPYRKTDGSEPHHPGVQTWWSTVLNNQLGYELVVSWHGTVSRYAGVSSDLSSFYSGNGFQDAHVYINGARVVPLLTVSGTPTETDIYGASVRKIGSDLYLQFIGSVSGVGFVFGRNKLTIVRGTSPSVSLEAAEPITISGMPSNRNAVQNFFFNVSATEAAAIITDNLGGNAQLAVISTEPTSASVALSDAASYSEDVTASRSPFGATHTGGTTTGSTTTTEVATSFHGSYAMTRSITESGILAVDYFGDTLVTVSKAWAFDEDVSMSLTGGGNLSNVETGTGGLPRSRFSDISSSVHYAASQHIEETLSVTHSELGSLFSDGGTRDYSYDVTMDRSTLGETDLDTGTIDFSYDFANHYARTEETHWDGKLDFDKVGVAGDLRFNTFALGLEYHDEQWNDTHFANAAYSGNASYSGTQSGDVFDPTDYTLDLSENAYSYGGEWDSDKSGGLSPDGSHATAWHAMLYVNASKVIDEVRYGGDASPGSGTYSSGSGVCESQSTTLETGSGLTELATTATTFIGVVPGANPPQVGSLFDTFKGPAFQTAYLSGSRPYPDYMLVNSGLSGAMNDVTAHTTDFSFHAATPVSSTDSNHDNVAEGAALGAMHYARAPVPTEVGYIAFLGREGWDAGHTSLSRATYIKWLPSQVQRAYLTGDNHILSFPVFYGPLDKDI